MNVCIIFRLYRSVNARVISEIFYFIYNYITHRVVDGRERAIIFQCRYCNFARKVRKLERYAIICKNSMCSLRTREHAKGCEIKKKRKREQAASPVELSAQKDAIFPLSLAHPEGKCKVVQTMINELYLRKL